MRWMMSDERCGMRHHLHLGEEQADGDYPDHASPGHVNGSVIVVLVQRPVHEQPHRAGRLGRDEIQEMVTKCDEV
jgi:hypothetical protein